MRTQTALGAARLVIGLGIVGSFAGAGRAADQGLVDRDDAAPRAVSASAPRSVSVTVYRNPDRSAGPINLNALSGFALVTEVREVHLPAGESRLSFERVADGVQTDTAIVSGLPDGVIEKNRDAHLLSPESLVEAAVGHEVFLVRSNPRSGLRETVAATLRSATVDGVMFETADGVEALKCSGLPETLSYGRLPEGLVRVPTLSVLTRSSREIIAKVTLSYLASDFDWAADYTARLAPDGASMDLGAWMTLANGNSIGFSNARVQAVAGRLNRSSEQAVTPPPRRVLARCWPEGAAGEHPDQEIVVTALRRFKAEPHLALTAPPTSEPPPPEALGDLKLYRLERSTTIAAHQSKQIRLFDRSHVAIERIYSAVLPLRGRAVRLPAVLSLRSQNRRSNNLGLPLPSGQVAVFGGGTTGEVLLGEASLGDTAVNETVELKLGAAPSVYVAATDASDGARTVTITNAGSQPARVELSFRLSGSDHIVTASRPVGMKDGRPIVRLDVAAGGAATVRYTVASERP